MSVALLDQGEMVPGRGQTSTVELPPSRAAVLAWRICSRRACSPGFSARFKWTKYRWVAPRPASRSREARQRWSRAARRKSERAGGAFEDEQHGSAIAEKRRRFKISRSGIGSQAFEDLINQCCGLVRTMGIHMCLWGNPPDSPILKTVYRTHLFGGCREAARTMRESAGSGSTINWAVDHLPGPSPGTVVQLINSSNDFGTNSILAWASRGQSWNSNIPCKTAMGPDRSSPEIRAAM